MSSLRQPPSSLGLLVLAAGTLLSLLLHGSQAQLTADFYNTTCPNAAAIVLDIVSGAQVYDVRLPASLTRLHFHDCFVNGCDASVLLEASSNVTSEKYLPPNISLRGFKVIDYIKYTLENLCPGVVSCSDILAIAAQASIFLSGGPSYSPLLGRRDGTTTDPTAALNLPSPYDSVTGLLAKFAAVGLNLTDLVALSGAHTFGRGQCVDFYDRVYSFKGTGLPDPTLNSTYLSQLKQNCSAKGNSTTGFYSLDRTTPDTFDNTYYINLLTGLGLFQSDQEIYSSAGTTASLVKAYASNQTVFFQSFVASMINMGSISTLTGTSGEIRKSCSLVNP